MADKSSFRRLAAIAVLFVGGLGEGCAGIGVHHVQAPDPIVAAVRRDHSPVPQTAEPADLADPSPVVLLSLSEASFSRGQAAEKHRRDDALACFVDSAAYAYLVLGRADQNTELRARTLYNAALAHSLRLAAGTGRLNAAHELHLPASSGGLVPVVHVGFVRPATDFGEIELCTDFHVNGLEHQFQTDGVGIPLIVRRPDDAPSAGQAYLPKGILFAATALLHFDARGAAVTLELVNPFTTSQAEINGLPTALAADLTTPLARFVAQRDAVRLDYLGFLRSDRLKDRRGIRMLEPYEPGKIPVILVHGLLSSPITWAPLLNELRGDPILRDRFQFWTCYYPTGHPFFGSAAEVRTDLSHLRSDLDPDHRDTAFEHMVLIGHSMGGLISKLVTQDGGPDVWRIVSARPLDELDVSPALREKLRDVFFSQREQGVTRVIFIGTPHHGATLSRSWVAWLAAHLVQFRADLDNFSKEMVQRIPDLSYSRMPTSIEMLTPESPGLHILAARPAPPGVHYHSVIGVEPRGWHLFRCPEPGDCVVAYRSAHLEGVDSELVVPANHFTVHQRQETVTEIRRILMEHLATLSSSEAEPAAKTRFAP